MTGEGDDHARFDAKSYHERVVRPLRATPRQIPGDLRLRYAVKPGLTERQLSTHLREVVEYWSARRELRDHSRAVYVALLDAHAALEADPDIDLHSPSWWLGYSPPVAYPAPPSSPRPEPAPPGGGPPAPPTVLDPPANDPSPPADPLPARPPPAPTPPEDGPLDVEAQRFGDIVRLSWVWPGWATQALVCWDGRRRTVDKEKLLPLGHWEITLGPQLAEGEVEFTVAVRGNAAGRQAWTAAVPVTAPGPPLQVGYRVHRKVRLCWERRYRIELTTDRPPVACEIAVGFATTGHLPGSLEECKEIGRAYLGFQQTAVEVVLPGPGPGWLRCFVVSEDEAAPVILIDPPTDTMRIRTWRR